ncbi:MAG TPA: sigma-70 family RNA polymerase sigma factor [Parafilimonas sp.]|nr:sigma-70 family RNA polymerase sigma factor [Parafilimonas sp.]
MKAFLSTSQIWEEHSEKLKAFICIKVNGDEHCHDILHDVFLKIKEKEERLKWIEQPATYIIKMAQNAVIDYYRSQKKAALLLQDDYAETAEEFSEIQLADCCLLSFIKALPPLYSQALLLTEFEGVSQKQLSEKLGISYTGAKSRVQRAKKMLKQAILNCCPYQFDKYGNIVGCCK